MLGYSILYDVDDYYLSNDFRSYYLISIDLDELETKTHFSSVQFNPRLELPLLN